MRRWGGLKTEEEGVLRNPDTLAALARLRRKWWFLWWDYPGWRSLRELTRG